MPRQTCVELLAPAGNFEKLETAVHFGADAVYLSGKDFSLRNFSGNFGLDELEAAVAFGRRHKVKIYIACNIYSRNHEQKALREYLSRLSLIAPDAIIVADPAIFQAARERMPHIPIHISTQANTTNYAAADFWRRLGAERVIAARELSLPEIKAMADRGGIAVEVFVHGALCISYSGRCLLSSYLANRDGNRGRCAQPCRWQYAVVEEKRPGQYLPIREDARGSYIFNSRDLCMIAHIPALVESGVCALKIEGRMKGIHYVAATVKAYREAIDVYYRTPDQYRVKEDWWNLLDSVNQRGYSTGFYFGAPDELDPNPVLTRAGYAHRLVGKILSAPCDGRSTLDVRNRMAEGDPVEILSPGRPIARDVITRMTEADGRPLTVAHAGMQVQADLRRPCGPNDLLLRCGDSPADRPAQDPAQPQAPAGRQPT